MKKVRNRLPSFGAVCLAACLLAVAVIFFFPGKDRTPAIHAVAQVIENPIYLPLVQRELGLGQYVLLGWNDLGMHCYNRDFQDLAVLPPYNNLVAQVIRRGDPPEVVTGGVTMYYSFPENTYSAGKTNFWDYEAKLFGVQLPNNIGLKGKGLSGTMALVGDRFLAEGIPITEFTDSNPATPQPYQLASIVAVDGSGKEIARNQVVAPVSTEMRCDLCHSDGRFNIRTGRVELNILTLHDQEHAYEYPAGHRGNLVDRRPVLCAECHASNALGAAGVSGVANLSHVMHKEHLEESADTLTGCYNCHPGPNTRCLRDVMAADGMDCIDCHGGMYQVSQNPSPWLKEPTCSTEQCHGSAYAHSEPLYRESKGHGGIYCEGCHDSTHAIAPSSQPRDQIKFINLQDEPGPIQSCLVCHITQPEDGGPHAEIN